MTFGGNNNKMEYPKKVGVNFVDLKKIAKFKKKPPQNSWFQIPLLPMPTQNYKSEIWTIKEKNVESGKRPNKPRYIW